MLKKLWKIVLEALNTIEEMLEDIARSNKQAGAAEDGSDSFEGWV